MARTLCDFLLRKVLDKGIDRRQANITQLRGARSHNLPRGCELQYIVALKLEAFRSSGRWTPRSALEEGILCLLTAIPFVHIEHMHEPDAASLKAVFQIKIFTTRALRLVFFTCRRELCRRVRGTWRSPRYASSPGELQLWDSVNDCRYISILSSPCEVYRWTELRSRNMVSCMIETTCSCGRIAKPPTLKRRKEVC